MSAGGIGTGRIPNCDPDERLIDEDVRPGDQDADGACGVRSID